MSTPEADEPAEILPYLDPVARLRKLGFDAIPTPDRITPGSSFQVKWIIPLTHQHIAFEVELVVADRRLGVAPVTRGFITVDPPVDQLTAKLLYRRGVVDISCNLRDTTSAAVLSIPLRVTVDLPEIATGWSWTLPKLTPVFGGGYVVGGRLVNVTAVTLHDFFANIHEIDSERPREDVRLENLAIFPGAAQPGETLSIEANAKAKKWKFYGPSVGPWARYTKDFRYELEIHASDDYGNPYWASAEHTVQIEVPSDKRRWAHAAVALDAAGWPLLAAGSLLIGAVAVGAAALGLVRGKTPGELIGAAGAKERADDPLEPDYDYGDTIQVTPPPHVEYFADNDLTTIADAVRDINYAILTARGLVQTEAKWLGARLRDNMMHAAIQRDRYNELVEDLRHLIEPLERHYVDLIDVRTIRRSDFGDLFNEWQQRGLPPALSIALRNEHVSSEAVGELRSHLLIYGSELAPESGIGPLVGLATAEVLAIVQEIVEGQAKAPPAPARA